MAFYRASIGGGNEPPDYQWGYYASSVSGNYTYIFPYDFDYICIGYNSDTTQGPTSNGYGKYNGNGTVLMNDVFNRYVHNITIKNAKAGETFIIPRISYSNIYKHLFWIFGKKA